MTAKGDEPVPTAQDQSVRALSEDLRLACMRVSRRVRFESDHEVAPHQFSVLARLEAGPLTPRALAEIEKVSAPSMTRTLTCLVDDGLLDRSDHPDDGRQVLISLTDAGRETLRRTRARRDAWMVSRVAELSETDRATLTAATQILDRIAAR